MQWVSLLEASAAKFGTSWLHSLYLGTAELEMGNPEKAAQHFNHSIMLQPISIYAERALAIFAASPEATALHYNRAWAHYKKLLAQKNDHHVLELGRELSTEYAAWLASGTSPQYDVLRQFIAVEKSTLAKVMTLKRPVVSPGIRCKPMILVQSLRVAQLK